MGHYYEGNTIAPDEAEQYFASWTLDELNDLREFWEICNLTDLALHLRRTEAACMAMYYRQSRRPPGERFTPALRVRRAWGGDEIEHTAVDLRPVNTIHPDEDRWWTPEYYLTAG